MINYREVSNTVENPNVTNLRFFLRACRFDEKKIYALLKEAEVHAND